MKVLPWSRVLLASSFFSFVFSAAASPVGLIPANAAWRYLSDGTDPGLSWHTLDFDDSAWPVGPAQLGYGEGDETTVVDTPVQRPVTVYFRRGVLIPSGTDLTLRLLRDDGAVVYFNGVEVRRDNMPAGPINPQTLAVTAVGGADETMFFETIIPASAVVPGTNVIAVEVHQNSVTGSDLSFALELIANFESPIPLVSVTTLDSEAREIPPWLDIPENPAVFQVRRAGGDTNVPLAVLMRLSGTASNGVDYESISNTVTIPAGSLTANVGVHAVDDFLAEGTETVLLSVIPPPPIFGPGIYLPGTNSTATAFILDNDQTNSPPAVSIHRPLDGATFRTPTNILLVALARDAEDGYDIAVEFFEGTNKIGNAVFIPSLCPAVECPSWYLEWTNVPPGNYTLRAKATDSLGAIGVSAPVNISVVSDGSNTNRVLVSMRSVWKYHDQCLDLGTAWRDVLYNDSTWPQGPAQLGYGDNDEATVISPGPDPNARCITDYFRRVFGVTNTAGISQLRGRLLQDDGGIVYLNGVEIFRSNLPAGEISRNTLAVVSVENQTVEFTAPAGLLVNGVNIVAVEMHQATATSGDLSFDLELRAEGSPPPTNRAPDVEIVTPQNGGGFPTGTSIFLGANVTAYNAGVQQVNFYTGSNLIGQAIGPLPGALGGWGLSWGNPPVGNHVLRAVAADTAGLRGTSAPVNIVVFMPGGTNNPPLVRVFASDRNASEAPGTNETPNVGRFTFTRSGSISNSLPIFFQLSGTASSGSDYTISSNFVVIPPGSSNIHLFVNPVDDAEPEETETVVATVIRPPPNAFLPPYNVGLPSNATVFIYDNDTNGPPPERTIVSVVALDPSASESGVLAVIDDGSFAVRRTGNLHADIPVLIGLTGSAINGVDYAFISNRVVIPAGSTQTVVRVVPLNDGLVEGTEAVGLTIDPVACPAIFPPPPACYDVGSPHTATVFIHDGTLNTNFPPQVVIHSPSEGAVFTAPANILLRAAARDPEDRDGVRVEFFEGANRIGQGNFTIGFCTNFACPTFNLLWSNVPPGNYTLTARATDSAGATTTSGPVQISVIAETSLPVVRVFATASNATEEPLFIIPFDTGTGIVITNLPPGVLTPANAGRFGFTRSGSLSNSLPVFFVLSGTALNGVDYVLSSNLVVFPPGSSNTHLTVNPIDDLQVEPTETVVLRLLSPPTSPDSIPYQVGAPSTATVFIHDNDVPTEPVPLIAAGSVWKYLDNGTDQGTTWRSREFDDSSWASGPAQLGYGDGDEATVVSGGPDPQNKYITTYFRRSFNVSNPASFSALTMRLLRDDGAVVHLNGVEVFRSNMPTGAVNHLALALVAAGGEDETSNFYSASINPSLLVNGQNVVAVEIHQVNPLSSDISFDLELIGTGGPQPPERTVIGVVATDSQASEPVLLLPAINPGQFAIRRMGNLDVSIPVSFVLSGTASNGSDYAFISNRVVIPAGSTQALVNVVPVADNVAEGTETVVLTLLSPLCIAIDPPPPECYLVGSPSQATVTITDESPGTNRPPVALWVAPPGGTSYPQGTPILLRASAHDFDGSVTRVEFRRGNLPIGLGLPLGGTNYSFLWSNPPVGTHPLAAIAVDNLNARGTSAPVNITVLVPTTNLPPTNVTFTLAFNNRDGTEGVFFRQYTLDGPVNGGRLLPAMRVVPDDAGQWYYGAEQHAVWRVNLISAQVEFMQIPPPLPELSWPIGSAFDSIRNRVLVGTLGGEGFLYAYSPATAQWSVVNDLDNHDLDSIVHHPADDFIYGFEGGYGGTPQLRKFDAGGNLVSSIPLPQVPVGITGHSSSSELVSVGEYLVLLIEPNATSPAPLGGESRIYLIDPRNGEVRLTYSRSLPADTDGDGVPDAEDQCPDTPLFSLVDRNGCSIQQRDSDRDGVLDSLDQCPNTSPNVVVDEHGCSAAQRDTDGDGVPDNRDRCANTSHGTVVNADGCSIAQIAPCDGPWRNHGHYINAVRDAASGFYKSGLITRAERLEIVHLAAKTDCGGGPRLRLPSQRADEIRTHGCRLILEGDGPATCIIESSVDLIRWTPVSTNALSGTPIELLDPGACTAPRRFYRIRLE